MAGAGQELEPGAMRNPAAGCRIHPDFIGKMAAAHGHRHYPLQNVASAVLPPPLDIGVRGKSVIGIGKTAAIAATVALWPCCRAHGSGPSPSGKNLNNSR